MFGKTERGKQLMRKRSKNKIEWRKITPNIKTKIRKGFLKKNITKEDIYLGEKDSWILAKKIHKQRGILIEKRACRAEFLAKTGTRGGQPAKTP